MDGSLFTLTDVKHNTDTSEDSEENMNQDKTKGADTTTIGLNPETTIIQRQIY